MLALLTIGLALLVSSCAADDGPLAWEEVDAGQQFGVVVGHAPIGRHYVLGSIVLCIDASSPEAARKVRITKVRAAQREGVAVTGYRIRHYATGRPMLKQGALPGRITESRSARLSKVSAGCRGLPGSPETPRSAVDELAIEFVKNSSGDARTEGLVVEYLSGRAPRDLAIPVTVWLCSGASSQGGCN